MGASRQFVDSFGFSWQALEITRDVQPERAVAPDNWLYFLSRGTTRRLRTYPAEWAVMSWADLEYLCTCAEVVGTDSGFLPVHAFSERLKATAGN